MSPDKIGELHPDGESRIRFLGFEHETYYPGGGLFDLAATFEIEADAITWCQSAPGDIIGCKPCREILDTVGLRFRRDDDADWRQVTELMEQS